MSNPLRDRRVNRLPPSGRRAPFGAGLAVWLRASDLASLVAPGDPVAAWVDRIGGVSFAQGTGARQPTFQPRGLNNKPSVRFDGTDDSLSASIVTLAPNSKTVYIAAYPSATITGTKGIFASGSANWYCGSTGGGAVDNRMFSSHSNASAVQKTVSSTADALVVGVPKLFVYRWAVSGSNVDVSHTVNGVQVQMGTFSFTDGISGSVGGTWTVGAFAAASLNFPGDIAEVLVYTSALADNEMAINTAYFKNIYKIG